MKILLRHVGKYKAVSILSPVFKLLEACFELTVPLIVAAMIDQGINKGDMGYVKSHIFILVLFAVVGFRVEFYSISPITKKAQNASKSVTWL